MEFTMVNEQSRDRKVLKTSYDWPAFFSPWIFGIPHFFRGQHVFGAIFFALNMVSFLPLPQSMSEAEEAFFMLLGSVLVLVLSIYMGKQGRKLLAKHLLEKGYNFEKEDSELVTHYKVKWGIL